MFLRLEKYEEEARRADSEWAGYNPKDMLACLFFDLAEVCHWQTAAS